MPIQFTEENDGEVLAVHVSGNLQKEDLEQFVPAFERHVQEHGKLYLLFDMTDFQGWEASALWEDTQFASNQFGDIDRLAMVGNNRWQPGMAMFCKPFTKATIRYFDHVDASRVRQWLKKT